MRFALSFAFAFASVATLSMFACSSDETPAPADAGTGSIAKPTDGSTSEASSSSGTPTKDCEGSTAYDCTKLTEHAKAAKCSKFDETKYKRTCEDVNCGTILQCEKEAKALNDCQLEYPATCDSDGEVVEAACADENEAAFKCLAGI